MVSVIIPTFNRANVLPRAINSVLAQTYKDFEIIIVDDSSSDNTDDVIKNFNDPRIRYIKHSANKGGSAARNTGIRQAKGEWIALLDSDDEWLENKLSLQVEAFLKLDTKVWGGIYCGSFYICNGKTWAIEDYKIGNLKKEVLAYEVGIGGGSTLMFHRQVFERIGFFDETFERHQDLEFLIRFFQEYKIHSVPNPLVNIYGHNMPPADKAVVIKEKFLLRFKDEIDVLGDKVSKRIHSINWYEIAVLYARESKLKQAFYYLKKVFYVLSFIHRALLAFRKGGFKNTMKSQDMRVLMIIQLFPPRYAGAAIQSIYLTKELKRQGLEVVDFLVNNAKEKTVIENLEGSKVFKLSTFSEFNGPRFKQFNQFIFFLRSTWFILTHKEYNIIFFHSVCGVDSFLVPLLKVLGRKSLLELTLVGGDDPMVLKNRKCGFLFLPAIRCFDKIVAISTKLYQLSLEAGIPQRQLIQIPVGVNTSKFYCPNMEEKEQMKQKLNLGEYQPIFLSIGKLEERKGYEFILKAWVEIQKKYPKGILLIGGPGNNSDNPCFGKLTKTIEDENIENVRFLGMITNVDEYMKCADMLLHAAVNEGLPNVLLEAALSGVPIVCRRIDGVTSDILLTPEIGREYLSDSPAGFAQKVSMYFNNYNKQQHLMDVQVLTKKFDIKEVAQNYIKLFKEITA